MSTFHLAIILAAVAVVLLAYWQKYEGRWKQHASPRFPPGPKPIPFLGNVHQLPSVGQQRTFAEWREVYGDLIYARLFNTPTIIINSLTIAQELLDKRSMKYAHRPRFILLQDLMGWDVLTHFSYGERFRKHRRWIASAFQDKEALQSYRPIQRREVYILLSGMFETPEEFMAHIRRYTAALIMEIVYGHSVKSSDDEYIHMAECAGRGTVESGNAGSMLVDFFPSLQYLPMWFPGAGFKRKAADVRKLVQKMLDTPFEMVGNAMASGTASPCFTASLLEEALHQGSLGKEDEDDIKSAAGVLYGAATDTTTATLSTFLLAMLLHPQVFRKAQAEMDRVVGPDQLPDFEDRESLPYLECVVKEVFRWNPPAPLGLPHRTMLQDEYCGYDIPADAMVIANIWAMTQDTKSYPEPSLFRPERFLDTDQQSSCPRDPRDYVFGFGRRACPGQEFADSSVWLAIANIVATVDISRPQDERGNPITPSAAFVPGFISHPREFKCVMKPKSEQVVRAVANMNANHAL